MLSRKPSALPGAPLVSFVPRAIQATAFGAAERDAHLVLGHRFSLEGAGRLDGTWIGLMGPGTAPARPVPRDFPKPGKWIAAWAELVVDWEDYWDEMAAVFTGVSRDGASISNAARDAAAAVTYAGQQAHAGPDLVLALRMRAESVQELGPWWRLGLQTRAARLAVNVTGLRFARPGDTPGTNLATSFPDFSHGVPVFADGYGFAAQLPSRRP